MHEVIINPELQYLIQALEIYTNFDFVSFKVSGGRVPRQISEQKMLYIHRSDNIPNLFCTVTLTPNRSSRCCQVET